ncbi:unnamed protein product [Paramecium pentaurelia]|uniref:Uncharacterized protein n=1 Tax=Paramecium pentaurelia TaxID=43138 RepID=A0A8S1TZI1_9CILI|nr:unnamed protein product [Paramecium pentaurelia]
MNNYYINNFEGNANIVGFQKIFSIIENDQKQKTENMETQQYKQNQSQRMLEQSSIILKQKSIFNQINYKVLYNNSKIGQIKSCQAHLHIVSLKSQKIQLKKKYQYLKNMRIQ